MSKNPLVLAFSALAMFTQTACVPKESAPTCTVEGTKYLSADTDSGQICRAFAQRVAQSFVSQEQIAGDINVAITLHKRGSVEAQVTSKGKDGLVTYPVVAVDVMDRPLAQGDLDRLADAVAKLLMDG